MRERRGRADEFRGQGSSEETEDPALHRQEDPSGPLGAQLLVAEESLQAGHPATSRQRGSELAVERHCEDAVEPTEFTPRGSPAAVDPAEDPARFENASA